MMNMVNNKMMNYQASSPKFLFFLLVIVNLLNFIDRGIIPGAITEFNLFIQDSINTDSPDVFLGFLQSSFVCGIIVGSLLFGHLCHSYSRIFLVSIGCLIWIVSAFTAVLAHYTSSYTILVFARILSGFGEASLQCTVPPWIQDVAPESIKATWLSIFYTAIPVGIAVGYAYSSFIASSLGWQWSFIIEALVSIPLTGYFLYVSSQEDTTTNNKIKKISTIEMHVSSSKARPMAEWDATRVTDMTVEENVNGISVNDNISDSSSESIKPSHWMASLLLFREEAIMLISNSIFMSLVAGYAAQTATLMGISTFGSAFMMGLGIFQTESESSTMFGILISIAGIIGTPLGGLLTDHATRGNEIGGTNKSGSSSEDSINVNSRLQKICELIYWSSFVGTVILCLLYFIANKALYLLLVTMGCAFLFLTTSAIAMGTMLTVPTESRAFSLGVNTVCIHLFGDVPSPIIAGYLKGQLAPSCSAPSSGSSDSGEVSSSPACRADGAGLRMTMFIIFAWCYFSVIFFWVAWRITLKRSLLTPS